MVQFVLPGVVAARAVSGINAVAKANAGTKLASQMAAAGAADAVVATNDTMTVGDFFEGGPTQTADLVGLEAEERALQGFANKFKVGIEGAGGVVLAPYIVRGIGEIAGAGASAVGQIPGATQAARKVQSIGKAIGRPLEEIEEARRMGDTQSPFKNAVAGCVIHITLQRYTTTRDC